MKISQVKILLLMLNVVTIIAIALGQTPQKIPYQAIARNAAGTVLPNQTIKLRFSIRNNSGNGDIVYQETQTATTSNIGLFSVNIGEGTVSIGTFAGINWANGTKFMQVELDPQGGNTFIDMGSQQMLSVPYALHAQNGISRVSDTGDSLIFSNGSVSIIPGISNANKQPDLSNTAHTCGALNVHNPSLNYGTMTDQQGNVYKTIVIGNQVWMAENLKTSIYRNGDTIPSINSGIIADSVGYLDENSQYECPFGKKYDHFAAVDPRNVCPTGWHVPSFNDFLILDTFLMNGGYSDGFFFISEYKIKSTGYWAPAAYGSFANNESGFSALPTEPIYGEIGYYWASGNFSSALIMDNSYPWGYVKDQPEIPTSLGFIRCLKD